MSVTVTFRLAHKVSVIAEKSRGQSNVGQSSRNLTSIVSEDFGSLRTSSALSTITDAERFHFSAQGRDAASHIGRLNDCEIPVIDAESTREEVNDGF